ncbi:hypothetical protein AVEN_246123-1 [Araneus ventricosus]|uniref:Uncharacterized protein n=1 Tax=Araneus ventricosus TaxID=182803 RepID=A0A4Y2HXT1_ARAVE|nr:hypothetical protein AVEN_246123-1 [Araneus ventricosus]
MGFEATRAEPNGLAVHRLNHEVYKNGIQYQNKQEFMSSIENAWMKISKNFLQEQSNSMASRLIKVIEKEEEIINYECVSGQNIHCLTILSSF